MTSLIPLPASSTEECCRIRDAIMESPNLIRQDWLRRKKWVGVPFEQHGFAKLVEVDRLVHALQDQGVEEVLFVFPTDTSVTCSAFQLAVSPEAIMEAMTVGARSAAARGCTDYMIADPDFDVLLWHHTTAEFSLLAGSAEVVEVALGASIASARHDWRTFATHSCWKAEDSDALVAVETWYSL